MPLPPPTEQERARAGLVRVAAVQRSDEPPSSNVLDKKLSRQGASDPQWLTRYNLWQDWARRFSRTLGVARFANSIVADTSGRCILRVEEMSPRGDWDETDDQALQGIFRQYRNPRQDTPELIRRHAWHYQVAGEMVQVVRDTPNGEGAQWEIYSTAAINWGKDTATIKETPNGTLREGTAFEVPRAQVARFWIPDEEWAAYATSPMAASIDDLHRYHALNRWATRTADSALAMAGVLFTPQEAHRRDPNAPDAAETGQGPGSKLQQDILRAANLRLTDDTSVGAIAPFEMHWDSKLGPPVWVEIGKGLDPHGIEYRDEALRDFARGVNLPSSLVVGGGGGSEGNHWSEWLVDERFFDISIAPVMDRITHLDLTQTFLEPYLRQMGRERDIGRFRIGYDPGPVIVRPDQSAHALRLYLAGLLKGETALEAANFDGTDDIMGPDEFAKVLDLASRGRAEFQPGSGPGGGGPAPDVTRTPIGPGTVAKGPPALPAGPPVRAQADGPQIIVIAPQQLTLEDVLAHTHPNGNGSNGHTAAAPPTRLAATLDSANGLLGRLAQIRRDAGRQLLSGAEVAFVEAIRHAGVKMQVRAKARSARVQKTVAAAVQDRTPLTVHYAAVGVTETELLGQSFDSYQQQAAAWLRRTLDEERRQITDAGLDPDEVMPGATDRSVLHAAEFLGLALAALAHQRLDDGHPLTPPPGEISGHVPGNLARQALDIAEGSASMVPGREPAEVPEVIEVRATPSVADAVARALVDTSGTDAEPEVAYTWVWGFYGEPTRPFEPHEELGASGLVTTDTETDPALTIDERGGWLDGDFYQPGDHPGCTCDWVPTIEARYPHSPATDEAAPLEIPDLGGSPEAIGRALDAAGA